MKQISNIAQQIGSLALDADCLAFFIDDTGHESLKGHPAYGVGGCAVMGCNYTRAIEVPWKRRRAGTTGSFEAQLHAAEFGQRATSANMLAMSRFFMHQPFFRFAAVATRDTEYPDQNELMAYVLACLKIRIVEILSRTEANSVALVFEASERADPLLMRYFGKLELEEDGKEIPVGHYLLPKSAADPALEVADFVMHAVGRMARLHLDGRPAPRDFDAVFRRCDPRLESFMLMTQSDCDEAIGLGLASPAQRLLLGPGREISIANFGAPLSALD